MRSQRLPESDRLDARLEATELLGAAYAVVPDAIPRPLARTLAALAGDTRDMDHPVLHDHAVDELAAATRNGDQAAADHAIWLLTSAAQAAAGDPFQPYYLSDLGTAWFERFQLTGRIRDLDNSVTVHERALETTVAAADDQAGRLANYSAALLARYGQREDDRDLSDAVAAARSAAQESQAFALARARHPTRAGRLAQLASLTRLSAALLARFERRGDRPDLDAAVQASWMAADLSPAGDAVRARHQASLAQALLERFGFLWNEADLTAAKTAAQAAVRAAHEQPAARALCLTALARAYCASYAAYRNRDDLDQAIAVARRAVAAANEAMAAGHSAFGQARALAALAQAWQLRYELSRNASALDEAITVYSRALQVTAVTRAERRRFLLGLGNALRARFGAAGQMTDIAESVTILSEAVAAARADDPARPGYAASLASSLVLAALAGDPGALGQAITVAQRELDADAAAPGPDRHRLLAVLGYAWRARFDQAGDDEPMAGHGPLGRAVAAFRAAADPLPPDHPSRPEYLAGLASVLRRRFERTGDAPAARDAIAAAAAAAQAAAACPRVRLRAAADWGRAAAGLGDAAEARNGFAAAVGLLDLAAEPRDHPRRPGRAARGDHLDPLGRLTSLACAAAAWAITAGHPEQAVELLEHGRGVLLDRVLGRGAAERDLRCAAPDLAARLAAEDQILAALPGAGDPMQASAAVLAGWRDQHTRDRDALLARIRARPGLGGFRQPVPFATLSAAAAAGPVVIINVSAYRCDALTLTPAGVQVTELPALTATEVSGRATAFVAALLNRNTNDPAKRASARATLSETLAWLRGAVITPLRPGLAAALAAFPAGTPPRIWWCPTGPMTFLPLHAAADALAEPADRAAARFVSSYAPTLSLLAAARQRPAPAAGGGRPLVIALPGRPGRGFRAAPAAEGRAAARQLAGAVVLRGTRATAAAVTQRLARGAPWLHVAGPGRQDLSDPAAGLLALHRGPLRIGEISALRLGRAELAVLPACEVACGGTGLADEAVSLATAFQVAGYRHVIGTLWLPPGEVPPGVAGQVYAELGQPGGPAPDAAAALHRAVAAVRREHPDEPWRWAPYVHIGP